MKLAILFYYGFGVRKIVGLDIDNVIAVLDAVYFEYFLRKDKNKRNSGIVHPSAKHITQGMFDWSDEKVTAFIADKMGRNCFFLKGLNIILISFVDKIYLLTHRKNQYWKNPVDITKQWLAKTKICYLRCGYV